MQVFIRYLELTIALLGIVGLLLNSRILTHGFRKDMLVYYTNLSNALTVIYYALRCIGRACGISAPSFMAVFFSPLSHYILAVMITVTFIIYHFTLLPAVKKTPEAFGWFGNYRRFSNLCVHYIVPLATLIYWLLLGDKRGLYWWAPLAWIVFPLLYAGCVLLRGRSGKNLTDTNSPYPYEFLDPIAIGWPKLGKTALALLAMFVALGYLLWGAGKLIGLLL